MSTRPILVTGTHRSGTTWTGALLSLSHETVLIHEPFNPTYPRSWLVNPPRRWFEYVDIEHDRDWVEQTSRVVDLRPPVGTLLRRDRSPRNQIRVLQEAWQAANGRRRNLRPLLKDPIAFFSAEWLSDRFDSDVVVLVRHPAAFASSLKRLGWGFDFANLTSQERLMRGPLAPHAREIHSAESSDLDIVDMAIVLWRVMNSVVLEHRSTRPDWIVRRYEDLASEPVDAFRELYRQLGLRWSLDVEMNVERHTKSTNADDVARGDKGGVVRNSTAAMWTWTGRLTQEEIERVRLGTAGVAAEFYGDDDWEPPPRAPRAE